VAALGGMWVLAPRSQRPTVDGSPFPVKRREDLVPAYAAGREGDGPVVFRTHWAGPFLSRSDVFRGRGRDGGVDRRGS